MGGKKGGGTTNLQTVQRCAENRSNRPLNQRYLQPDQKLLQQIYKIDSYAASAASLSFQLCALAAALPRQVDESLPLSLGA